MCLNRCCTALGLWFVMAAVSMAAPMKALIVDGQNAHNWKETTPILKSELEETGLFTVDVATSPEKGQDMSAFRPDFAAYKLVVLNYQGDDWPEATRKAFVDYVANGGGVVVYHFACAAFPKWKEYNQIIGVAAGAIATRRPARICAGATAKSFAAPTPRARPVSTGRSSRSRLRCETPNIRSRAVCRRSSPIRMMNCIAGCVGRRKI
jgi:hypothetical protein